MKNNYILVTWYWDESSDYQSHWSFEEVFEFIKDDELKDINALMQRHGVKRWVKNPQDVTAETWQEGDGSLVEFRNVLIKPVKIVESWSYKPEIINK